MEIKRVYRHLSETLLKADPTIFSWTIKYRFLRGGSPRAQDQRNRLESRCVSPQLSRSKTAGQRQSGRRPERALTQVKMDMWEVVSAAGFSF
jgi:hypothetical protein